MPNCASHRLPWTGSQAAAVVAGGRGDPGRWTTAGDCSAGAAALPRDAAGSPVVPPLRSPLNRSRQYARVRGRGRSEGAWGAPGAVREARAAPGRAQELHWPTCHRREFTLRWRHGVGHTSLHGAASEPVAWQVFFGIAEQWRQQAPAAGCIDEDAARCSETTPSSTLPTTKGRAPSPPAHAHAPMRVCGACGMRRSSALHRSHAM